MQLHPFCDKYSHTHQDLFFKILRTVKRIFKESIKITKIVKDDIDKIHDPSYCVMVI